MRSTSKMLWINDTKNIYIYRIYTKNNLKYIIKKDSDLSKGLLKLIIFIVFDKNCLLGILQK